MSPKPAARGPATGSPARPGWIALFDSGVGGLSIWREVRRLLPGEDLLYLADSAHVPYGPRPQRQIQGFSLAIARALMEAGAELVIVACNAASAAALRALRETYPEVPFVGMVPALRPAVAQSRARVVGVLATPATLDGELYAQVREQFAPGVEVINQVCHGLVEAVEAGHLLPSRSPEDHRILRERLAACLDPLQARGVDTLVLGCTHYPFLRPILSEMLGPRVRILDSGEGVARQVGRVLWARREPRRTDEGRGRFYTTGDPAVLRERLEDLLQLSGADVRSARWKGERLRL